MINVLQELARFNLKINADKSEFSLESVKYLGYEMIEKFYIEITGGLITSVNGKNPKRGNNSRNCSVTLLGTVNSYRH